MSTKTSKAEREKLLSESKKKCGGCHEIKALDKFDLHKGKPSGHQDQCNLCRRKYYEGLKNRNTNVDLRLINEGKFKQCPDCTKEGSGELPTAAFSIRRLMIDGLCVYCKFHEAIRAGINASKRRGHAPPKLKPGQNRLSFDETRCSNPNCIEPVGIRLQLDHCHKTGFIRGWLCYYCNTLEGLARSSVDVLKGMIEYMESHTA